MTEKWYHFAAVLLRKLTRKTRQGSLHLDHVGYRFPPRIMTFYVCNIWGDLWCRLICLLTAAHFHCHRQGSHIVESKRCVTVWTLLSRLSPFISAAYMSPARLCLQPRSVLAQHLWCLGHNLSIFFLLIARQIRIWRCFLKTEALIQRLDVRHKRKKRSISNFFCTEVTVKEKRRKATSLKS